jgi:hypothetical protein
MNFIHLGIKKILRSKIVLLLLLMCGFAITLYAMSGDDIDHVAQITGNKPNRVAQLAEIVDREAEARRLARSGSFDAAVATLTPISRQNGFKMDDERGAEITAVGIYVVKGDYATAHQLTQKMNKEKRLQEEYVAFIKAMYDFDETGNKAVLLEHVKYYNFKNPNITPPIVHDLNYLNRMIRVLEMAGEIDQTLALVDEYLSPKSLKFHQREKTREGFKLLKEALLHDKEEGKNIYAQELINTTDYFGFV